MAEKEKVGGDGAREMTSPIPSCESHIIASETFPVLLVTVSTGTRYVGHGGEGQTEAEALTDSEWNLWCSAVSSHWPRN